MNLLYHLWLWLYRLIAIMISPFHVKAALFSKGHRGLISKIKQQVSHDAPIVWFHCSSLGEFEQGRPIIEGYRFAHPEHKIVVTFFSPSGYEVIKGNPVADWIYYLPLDTCRNVRRFLNEIQPIKAIFIKYEFWYNFLRSLNRRNIPTFLVSATFRPSQPFFKWYGTVFRRMLHMFSQLFVQDHVSAALLGKTGITNVVVAGDTRFDRVWKQSQQPCTLPIVEAFCKLANDQMGAMICVAGSTWPRDEVLLCHTLEKYKQLRLVLVPHEIDAQHIESIIEQFAAFNPVRYSHVYNIEMIRKDTRVLMVDTIGLLSSLYRFGSMAYVGGGFENGIHNILEAAVYGIPVVFGPNYEKFNEAVALVGLGGAFAIGNRHELAARIGLWLSDSQARIQAGGVCAEYVESHGGATGIVLHNILVNNSCFN